MSDFISETQLAEFLQEFPEWKREGEGKAIERILTFGNFSQAMKFVNEVAEAAEEANHHPDIGIRWNKVHLVLTTHSAGGLTVQDLEMARRVDRIV